MVSRGKEVDLDIDYYFKIYLDSDKKNIHKALFTF